MKMHSYGRGIPPRSLVAQRLASIRSRSESIQRMLHELRNAQVYFESRENRALEADLVLVLIKSVTADQQKLRDECPHESPVFEKGELVPLAKMTTCPACGFRREPQFPGVLQSRKP